ncbi:MAG: Ig-like domain-containing protein [Christensenellales bacterium]
MREIECINEEARDMGDYKMIIVDYIEGNRVQLSYRVTPDDATNKDVRFIYDENQTVATVTDLGTVVFFPGLCSSYSIYGWDDCF